MPTHPPITSIDTRTAAFIGHVPGRDDPPGTLHAAGSWAEFNQLARLLPASGRSWNPLSHAVQGFFLNGGVRCLVVESPTNDERGLAAALAALAAGPEATTVAAPGWTTPAAYAALIDHCETRRDRLAILDGPATITADNLKVLAGRAAAAPDGWSMPSSPGGYEGLYVPWLRVADPEGPAGATVLVPPAGHIAGAWARNDARQGSHKAPANLELIGAMGLAYEFTSAEQEQLNPNGANVIRSFPGRGILIWGARTLSPDPEWRYINVRRTVTLIGESIRRGIAWAAAAPAVEATWAEVRRAAEEYLFALWRDGVLLGTKPEHGFFARCDLTTMTQADIDNGRLVLLVGLAVVRPAEFIIIRIFA